MDEERSAKVLSELMGSSKPRDLFAKSQGLLREVGVEIKESHAGKHTLLPRSMGKTFLLALNQYQRWMVGHTKETLKTLEVIGEGRNF